MKTVQSNPTLLLSASFAGRDVILESSLSFCVIFAFKLNFWRKRGLCCGCYRGDHAHTHTRAHALRTWAKEGEIIANPIQWLVHPFLGGKVFFCFPLGSSTLRLCPHRGAPTPSSIASPERGFSLPLDTRSSLALRLKFFFVFFLNQKLFGFVRVWSRDLEMKTDFPLICRIWIGIACASGEQTFYCELWSAEVNERRAGSWSEAPFPGSWKFSEH